MHNTLREIHIDSKKLFKVVMRTETQNITEQEAKWFPNVLGKTKELDD